MGFVWGKIRAEGQKMLAEPSKHNCTRLVLYNILPLFLRIFPCWTRVAMNAICATVFY
jgi:hypothetical protein